MGEEVLRVTLVAASIRREGELPGFEEVRDFASHSYNLALPSMKAAALAAPDLAHGVSIALRDLSVTWDRPVLGPEAADEVIATAPDVLGLSCYCWSIDTLLALAERVVSALPETFVVLGGPSAASVAGKLLRAHPFVDAVATSEGEGTFTALLRQLRGEGDLSAVPGLWGRGPEGEPVESRVAPAEVDLAALPSIYRSGVVPQAPRALLLETSRGCRHRCRFCSWVSGPRKLRYVPVESIEGDLRWALAQGVESVKLTDSTINADTARLGELTAAFRRADPEGRLRFSYFLKAETLTDEQVDLLRGLPSDEIIVGVESLDDEVRRAVGKPPLDRAAFESLLGNLSAVGPATLSLIMGLPGDDVAGLARTLDWAVDLDERRPGWVHEICLFWLAVLPGSRLHDERVEQGLRVMPAGSPYLLESREHAPPDLLEMARLAAERHYGHPKLRMEYFHGQYLSMDGPEPDRHVSIPRDPRDDRPVALLVGTADVDDDPDLDGRPYGLEVAWMKAFAEADPDLLRSWRIEQLHAPCRRGWPLDLEAEALTERVAVLAPRLVLLSADRCASAGPLLAALRLAAPEATMLLSGVAGSMEGGARLLGGDLAVDGVVVGEGERPIRDVLRRGGGLAGVAGIVCRRDEGMESPGLSPVVVSRLDDIPSPFQWGLVQRGGRGTVPMRLSRPAVDGGSPRAHGAARIYGDMRWATEQRHDHVLWLDAPALPDDLAVLEGFVGALRRADPSGRLRHSYRLGAGHLRAEVLALLGEVRARRIVVPPGRGGEGALEGLARRSGGAVVEEGAGPAAERLGALLRPWVDRGAVEGFVIDRVLPAPLGGARAVVEGHGGRVVVDVVKTVFGTVAVDVRGASPAPSPEALRRLDELITRWVDRGGSFLAGER